MDTLRDSFGALDSDFDQASDHLESDYDEAADSAPPPPGIGTDERRMQVRAYNFWAGLLDDRNLPAIDDLDPANLPEFGDNSVLLNFSRGLDNPEVVYLGEKLAAECAVDGHAIGTLADVPAGSLLSRITDHYMQILANQAPIGFEAEFVSQSGATVLYRGILLPFSSDDESIDFIYGVINWKELAGSDAADELLLEIDQALAAPESPLAPRRAHGEEMVDWADGPAAADSELMLDVIASAALDPAEMHLADWLAAAREMAQTARNSEERTRSSLYEAVSRAYDFAVAALQAPEDFAVLLADAKLTMQERAPMTPVVKLVFGVDYDKTRLTEYAAVLSWARRNRVERGTLADHLKTADGGLKGIIAAERAFRREQDGKPATPAPRGPKKAIARKLRALEPRTLDDVTVEGEEFGLVMIRRTEEGTVVILGEVPTNVALIEKAAHELLD